MKPPGVLLSACVASITSSIAHDVYYSSCVLEQIFELEDGRRCCDQQSSLLPLTNLVTNGPVQRNHLQRWLTLCYVFSSLISLQCFVILSFWKIFHVNDCFYTRDTWLVSIFFSYENSFNLLIIEFPFVALL